MSRRSIWPMLVVFLLGILLLREPRFEQVEENFLRWLLRHSEPSGAAAPLTVVEIGRDRSPQNPADASTDSTEAFLHTGGITISPLEYALFLQSVLEFQPTVVAFENILRWRERDRDQEQVFLDQAMRVPKLLLGAELTNSPDPDTSLPEILSFTQVTGSRRDLIEFSGVGRQPNEDLRLISTLGFSNLPPDLVDDLHVPLLFRCRGEVIPAFALQAILLWLRITPGEVKIDTGSHILLPGDRKIPIYPDGTMLINLNAAKNARRVSLNELLVAAQQRGRSGTTTTQLENIRKHIVLARTPANPLAPPDIFAAAIATIQNNKYLRRVSRVFDCIILVLATTTAGFLGKVSRGNIVIGAIAFSAAYCLIALGVMSRFLIWLPGYLPLGAVWLIVLISLCSRRYNPPRQPAHKSSVS
jgi:hypothetical protein